MAKYHIIEMGKAGRFQDFEDAILVKVIPVDFIDYYYNNEDDYDYEENINQNQVWLMFKNYPGKEKWLLEKARNCDMERYWDIDLEKFIPHFMSITDNKTGEGFVRSIYQVIMIDSNLDAIDASEKGISYKGRTGHQQLLDSFGLTLIGTASKRYYILSQINNMEFYAIPYYGEANEAGLFYFDKIKVKKNVAGDNGFEVIDIVDKVGVYNYLTRQIFTFK